MRDENHQAVPEAEPSETSRRIWESASEATADEESWPGLFSRVIHGYLTAIELDPTDMELRCEAAASFELLRLMLRAGAITVLREGIESDPEHAEARWLIDAFRGEVTLSTRAAYREAGQAVAQVMLGRCLVRTTYDVEADDTGGIPGEADDPREREAGKRLLDGRGTWADAFAEAFTGSPLPERATELLHWLREIPRMREAGVLSDEEAAEAAADLWWPFALLAAQYVREAYGTPEDRLRRDLAALLAGGEAERVLTRGAVNSSLDEARKLCAERTDPEVPGEARARALSWAISRAEAIVRDGWPAIQALAQTLLEEEHLDGPAAERIIRRALGEEDGDGGTAEG